MENGSEKLNPAYLPAPAPKDNFNPPSGYVSKPISGCLRQGRKNNAQRTWV
jgi:hypothetical protein